MLKNLMSIHRPHQLIIIAAAIFLSSAAYSWGARNNVDIEEGRLRVGTAEIYYKISGNGPPTFILHGGPGDTHDTMLQLNALSDQYRLVFYDQRAAGRSTGDADTTSHTVEQFVYDLEQLRLNLAPEKINLIGGSWGAMLAMQYAMRYSCNINAMVLMSSMGISSDYLKFYQSNIDKNRSPEDSLRLAEIQNTDGFKNGTPEAMKEFWRIYFRSYFYHPDLAENINLWMRDDSYKTVPGKYAKLIEFLNDYDIREGLKKISCPTLILHGDHDPTPVEWVTPIHESIASSQFVLIRNAGHWLWVEAPDQTFPLIRNFLKIN